MIVPFFYARFWDIARKNPKLAMSAESLGDIMPKIKSRPTGDVPSKPRDDGDDDNNDNEPEPAGPRVDIDEKKAG
jgi:hypothetical protein